MPNPQLQGWFAASVAKADSRSGENEDATAADPKRVRFALADGATEGWQSGVWANYLAQAYIEQPPCPADFTEWLAKLRNGWKPPAPPREVWYTEVKQEQGSFATLLGLELRRSSDSYGLVWKAVAVGDSCLFVVRGESFDVVFPLTSADEFDNQPPLVPSSVEQTCPEPEWLAGRSEPGDLFLLTTDAVARCILQSGSSSASPIVRTARQSVTSGRAGPMVELLGKLRSKLKDDASVIAIQVAAEVGSTT
jgi:hypothetical protein